MGKINFENVTMALGDQNRDLRQSLVAILRQHGFHNVVHSGTMPRIEEAAAASRTDLIVCDVDLPEGDLCQLAKDIRYNRMGSNPFVVIMVLADEPASDKVRNIINAGVDDLILKPISAGLIAERIVNLTKTRKKFIVTTDYIGPDRRKAGAPKREGQEIPQIDAPNPLAVKTSGGSLADMEEQMQAALHVINEQKVERHAFQIEYLVNKIMPIYRTGATKEVTPLVQRLVDVSEDIRARLETTKYAHVSELCNTMHEVAERISKRPLKPERKDVGLLPNLAQAINKAFAADQQDVELARDISKSIKATG
ncbi:MAG: response regulator [Alphaproteobacteria bacterium]|nr:response regulator [Alphaproteobacteria bacterium]